MTLSRWLLWWKQESPPKNMSLEDALNMQGCCPDCGSYQFHPGPAGGMAINIKCGGCGACFWYGPPFAPDRIEDRGCYPERLVKLEEL